MQINAMGRIHVEKWRPKFGVNSLGSHHQSFLPFQIVEENVKPHSSNAYYQY